MQITEDLSNTEESADVLDVIYDVALDPERYDELSDAWADRLWPQIAAGGAAELENRVSAHILRAEKILDRISTHPEDAEIPEIARYVEDIGSSAALIFDHNLHIAATNEIGAQFLSAKVGGSVANLPIIKADLDSFLNHNRALLQQHDSTQALVRVRR